MGLAISTLNKAKLKRYYHVGWAVRIVCSCVLGSLSSSNDLVDISTTLVTKAYRLMYAFGFLPYLIQFLRVRFIFLAFSHPLPPQTSTLTAASLQSNNILDAIAYSLRNLSFPLVPSFMPFILPTGYFPLYHRALARSLLHLPSRCSTCTHWTFRYLYLHPRMGI